MSPETVLAQIHELASQFALNRRERQQRRHLDPSDFDALAAAGFLLTGLPSGCGGLWAGARRSVRLYGDLLRILARGDASVALVASMHPAVLLSAGWLQLEEAPAPYQVGWSKQRQRVLETVRAGSWWATASSEPGTGSDLTKTKAVARATADGSYRISGHKHFASGLGVADFMITFAVPEGEPQPDLFFLHTSGQAWADSGAIRLTAAWEGHGMAATQSHAVQLADAPGWRSAWPRNDALALGSARGVIQCMWTAVTVGIVEAAVAEAAAELGRRPALNAYEQMEWARVLQDAWVIRQAYAGAVAAVEGDLADLSARQETLRGRMAVADLAEGLMQRICRVIGGSAYSRHKPYGHWFEDVRALGFLRPVWGLAWDQFRGAGLDCLAQPESRPLQSASKSRATRSQV